MNLVDFRYRKSKPINPLKGTFYWIDDSNGTQIWFAPTENVDDLILLNKEFPDNFEEIKNELQEYTNEQLEEIRNKILTKSDLDGYAKESWIESKGYLTEHQSLDGYAKLEDIPNFDDSDFDLSNKIKTINGQSLLGSGDITIEGTGLDEEQIEKINKIDNKLDKEDLVWQII